MPNGNNADQDVAQRLKAIRAAQSPSGATAVATGDVQPPQFSVPNAYAYQPGQAPNLPMGVLPQNLFPASDPEQFLTQALAAQTKMSTEETPTQLGRSRATADAAKQAIAEEAAIAPPRHGFGYNPHFQPMDSPGHVLGNIGKGALLFLGSTAPGRAVQEGIYGPEIRRYETERAEKAQKIAQLLGLQKQEEEPIAALSSLGPKSMMGYGRGVSGAATEKRTEGQLRHWQNQDANALDKIAETHRHNIQSELARLKALELTGDQRAIERQELSVRMAIAGMETDSKNYATDAGLYENEYKAYTQTKIQNLVQGAGLQRAHPFLSGVGYTTAPQIEVPPQPRRPSRPTGGGGTGKGSVVDQLVKKHGG